MALVSCIFSCWPCNPHECMKEEHVENVVFMLATQHSEIKMASLSLKHCNI